MADNKQQTQSRFLLAALLSLTVFFAWSYFFAPKKPIQDNANTAQVVDNNATTVAATATTETLQNPSNQQQAVTSTPDNTENKTVTIKTPLYQVKLDSKGALATSWVLIKNISTQDKTGKLLYADGSNGNDKKPLELISSEGLNRTPREIPFRLSTGDQNTDNFINERNYQVSSNEDSIELSNGQSKQIDYVLRDEASGLEVTKSFLFRADSYVTDLQVKLTKNGQSIPNTKLLIGSSIGDQGIKFHNYYHIEPEAVSFVNGSVNRHQGASFTFDKNNQSSLTLNGNVDWAGVADAYFAMAAIPSQQANAVEFRATKYDVDTDPHFDGIISWITRSPKTTETRHLVTAYLPISTDGSTTKIYTGTKDYFVLSQYDDVLTQSVGRTIDIDDIVNFSNWTYIRPITKRIAIPILYALNFLNNFTNSYGVAIIIFTLFFYSLLFPMRWYQSKSFKKASGNQPKMKELQEKLKEMQKKGIPADDPRMRELQMEQLKMTKDALPIGGCLPMVLQFPLLIALYTAVTISLGFRQAPFLWLPDLSAADPYHLLEFGFAFSMILSMKFTPQATAVASPEQQTQQKMMTYFMPVMMLWIMWSAPAGLLIYWLFGNIVSFVQQILINRINKPNDPPKEGAATILSTKTKPKLSMS